MPLYLGIDGGGTKTNVALADDSRILAWGHSAGCSPVRYDVAQIRQNLHAAIESACFSAGVSPTEITQTCVGSAGVSANGGPALLQQTVREIVGGELIVVGDMVIAHAAAFFGYPGVVVIAGTGSIAFGINEAGEMARAGGWGPSASDEGSGPWVGKRAVAALLRAMDAGEETGLSVAILLGWGVRTHEELVHKANAASSIDYGQLFPAIQTAVAAGDGQAREIMLQAGAELAGLAKLVHRKLWPRQQRIQVAMTGGIFQNSPNIRQAFYNCLRAERPEVQVRFTMLPPVLGAVSMARRAAQRNQFGLRIRLEE